MAVANQRAKRTSAKPAAADESAAANDAAQDEKVLLRIPQGGAFDVVRDEDFELHRGQEVAVDPQLAKRLLARPGQVVEQVNPSR